MTQVIINNTTVYEVESTGSGFICNREPVQAEIIKVDEDQYHLISNHKTYRVFIHSKNPEEKSLKIRINGQIYEAKINEEPESTHPLTGILAKQTRAAERLVAPMPGLIISIFVKEGDSVKQGEPLIVLKAMKMENILKAPGSGTITRIWVKEGASVEKNEIIIQF